MCVYQKKNWNVLSLILSLIIVIISIGVQGDFYSFGSNYRTVHVNTNISAAGNVTAKDGEQCGTAYYDDGAYVTVNAVANEGYTFVRWLNNSNVTMSTSSKYTFTITSDIDLTAEFRRVDEKYSGGTGTINDPYEVSTPEDLISIYNEPDKYYKQTANINMSEYTDMTTIGNGGALFTGTYDGNGKTIRNLTIHRPNDPASANGASYYVGLFNIGTTGIVKDLDIETASIEATSFIGILAGINYGQIINCHVDGDITASHNDGNAGGLVGVNYNTVKKCSAAGSISGNHYIGGLVGINSNGSTHGLIQDSYANVTVQSYGYSGGLVGTNENDATIETSFAKGNVSGYWTLGGLVGNNNGSINDCYASSNVHHTSDGEYLGGLVGYNGGSILRSYAYGAVDTSTNSGGLIGFNNDVSNIVSRCYYDQESTGLSDTDKGLGKTTAEMTDQDTYDTWDFGTVWAKQSNTYPYFKWQHANYPVVGDLLNAPTLSLSSAHNQTVNLTWSGIATATSYKVYIGTASGVYQEVLSTGDVNASINSLTNGTTYYFVVKALNGSGESFYSNEITASPVANYMVSIRCIDENGNPLPDAHVTIGSEQITTTDSGIALFSLPNGSYSVNISKEGYGSLLSLNGLTVKGSDLTKEFTLSRDTSLHYLSLSVLDYDEVGIEGVTVTITTEDGKTSTTSITIANGTMGVYLKDGNYHLKATKTNYEDFNTTFTVNGANLTSKLHLLQNAFILDIYSKDVLHNILPDGTVTIKDDDGNQIATSQTNNQGYFSIMLQNGIYNVMLEKDGYTTNQSIIIVDNDDQSVIFELDYKEQYQVNIKVVDEYGAPCEGASVIMNSRPYTTTGSGVVLLSLPNGTYSVGVRYAGYLTTSGAVTVNGADVYQEYAMSRDPDQHIFFMTVKNQNNEIVSGASVTITADDPTTNISSVCDELGQFGVYLKDGSYQVKVTKSKYNDYESTFTINGATIAQNIILEKTGYILSIVVLDEDGNRLTGATVTVKDSNGNQIVSVLTGDTGVINVFLENGYYSIRIEKSLYKTLESGLNIIGAEKTAYFELNKNQFLLSINVKNQIGEPVNGATVRILGNDNENITGQTNDEGWISVYTKNGYQSIKIEKDGYETIQSGVTIIGEERTANFTMNAPLFTSYFILKDTEGNPVSDARVFVTTLTNIGVQAFQSDVDGKVIIELPKGIYMASFVKDGYSVPYTSSRFDVLNTPNTYEVIMDRTKYYMPIYAFDSAKNPLVQATINVKNTSTNINESSSTGTDGRALFFLQNGSYEITISHAGYTTKVVSNLNVSGFDLPNYFFYLDVAPPSGSSGGSNHTAGNGNLLPSNAKPQSEDNEEKPTTIVEIARNEVNGSLVRRTDDKVVADLSKVDLTKEVSNINDLANQREGQNSEFNPNGTTENKITLVVPVDSDAKEFEVALPDLDKIFEKLDRVSIESELASFELKKDTFGDLGNDDIVLSASKLDRENLPEHLKESLPEGVSEVIDLNAYVANQKVSQFQQAIEVSIPYTLKDGEDPEKVSFYLLNDNGVIEKIVGQYDVATGKMKVKRTHFSMYFITVSDVSFDDIQNSWAKQQIEVLAGQGIINGKTTDSFEPNGSISRAEFASLIARLLDLDETEDDDIFTDIKEGAWYQNSVNGLYDAGIVSGWSSNTFAPNKQISRQEAATIIANALSYLGYSSYEALDGRYKDSELIASWAANQVETVYQEGIMDGFPNGQFQPKANLTRAQAAQIIYQLYQKYMAV